jgi:hypothetical protein
METKQQLTLGSEEWDLVTELVERERRELHAEIHQTDSHEYRTKLSRRLELVDQVLNVLSQEKVA